MKTPSVNKKLIVIVGPTASGKSMLAIRLARKLNGEIISADSRQVYKGLEIGSGAVTIRERAKIPHHLIGFVNPKRTFTAAEYKKLARREVERVWKRGRLPILAGGAGLYVRATVDGLIMPEVKPNPKLRKELGRKGTAELSRMLKKADRRRWEEIDKKNPRRLIRALEIAETLGKVPKMKFDPLKAEILLIGTTPEKKRLETAIRERVRKMVRGGLVRETKKLLGSGVSGRRIREFGFEYADTLDFMEGKTGSEKELRDTITRDTLRYAKRKMTWFKNDNRIHWIKSPKEALDLASKFLYH